MRSDPQPPLLADAEEPLAARMRPRTIDEFVGQEHILGPGRLLRRAIQADQLSSLILHGPPGTGKTTLARVIANRTRAEFTAVNAVLSGVKDIRAAIEAARGRQREGRRTILFVDEVHRFNKSQQDALLPWVENGTVLLIGATTENPYFEVNKALVSRSRIFQLRPLDADDLRRVAEAALADRERGYGRRDVRIDEDALAHLVEVANGDARSLLNALELAVETTEPDGDGTVRITREVAEESIQRRAVLYDKEGDAHFDVISAFIKSVRGSDPDASLYWLAKMVYAGEDPRFLFRRMLILASEDVGLADPQALVHTRAALAAFDAVGLPEGRYHLAQATLYLANAAKSNSTMGFFDALAAVADEREGEVPAHLKDASRDREGFGHGQGYLYPHAYRDHFVAQQYLPAGWQGRVFYRPSDQGDEAAVREQVARRREAQLAAMLEEEASPEEILTTGPGDRRRDRWVQRTLSGRGRSLEELRQSVFARLAPARHQVLLDLRAGTGLFTFEALRYVPEGQVWSLAGNEREAEALRQQAEALPELERPVVLVGGPTDAQEAVAHAWRAAEPEGAPLRFDAIVGRDVLASLADPVPVLRAWAEMLRPGGRIVLAEPVPAEGPRLYGWVGSEDVDAAWLAAARDAEEAAYAEAASPRFRWLPEHGEAALAAAGLSVVRAQRLPLEERRTLTQEALDGWFGPGAPFRARLRAAVPEEGVRALEAAYRRALQGRELRWRRVWALLHAAAS